MDRASRELEGIEDKAREQVSQQGVAANLLYGGDHANLQQWIPRSGMSRVEGLHTSMNAGGSPDVPLAEGLVGSLARPGGNVTGFSLLTQGSAAKRVELLTTVGSGLSRIAVLWHRDRPGQAIRIQEIQAASVRVGVHLAVLDVGSPPECDRAFATRVDHGVGAALVLDSTLFFQERTRLAALAALSQMPVSSAQRGFVEAGGLLAYGPSFPA